MEDRRITYAVSNFSSVNDGDTNQADSDPGPVHEAPAGARAPAVADDRAAEAPPAAHRMKDERPEPAATPEAAMPETGNSAEDIAARDIPAGDISAAASAGDAIEVEPTPAAEAAPLPVMALPADDPETHIDEARLQSALALRKLPLSPRQFYTRQRANMVSLLAIIAAIGAAGWYVNNARRNEATVVKVRDADTADAKAKQTAFIPAKPLTPALYTVPLPKIEPLRPAVARQPRIQDGPAPLHPRPAGPERRHLLPGAQPGRRADRRSAVGDRRDAHDLRSRASCVPASRLP